MEKGKENKFGTLLVGLDRTDMDLYLIRYAALLCKTVQVKAIYFVHAVESIKFPELIMEEFPDVFRYKEKTVVEEMLEVIQPAFSDVKDTKVKFEIVKGHPIENMLKYTRSNGVDMILMGRKRNLKGSGIVSSRLARKAPCSLLLIPEEAPPTINNITVPVDFSGHSALALSYAHEIAGQTGAQVSCLHLYHVPIGYYKTGKSYEEFADIMLGNATAEFKQFSAKHHLASEYQCNFVLNKGVGNAELILEKSIENKTDLLIIGSRGRTAPSSVLIGSLAEKLVYKTSNFPILIAKNKGENMGFLEALFRI